MRQHHAARRTVAHTTAGAVAVHTVPTRRRREPLYRAGQQEIDGTIMLYGAVGGHMCSFAQLTDYSRGLEVGRRKAPRERFACGAPARPWTRLHRCLRTVDRIAYRIANDQCRDHLDLALPAC